MSYIVFLPFIILFIFLAIFQYFSSKSKSKKGDISLETKDTNSLIQDLYRENDDASDFDATVDADFNGD
ncbi:hypothetical protein [Sulfurimonas paralvinellae]|uniref:Uncharacterized protein n=1 Tax=Sulfurimonas paralvinellae TaxID=317658 RepID=A0A7M1B963_9BACT|nr:hypothetical protein [Sulfurimonas paralvinellae]QOP45358.1 hypothetical protein FM071_03290 [Sulfurimonas paralvinellae]